MSGTDTDFTIVPQNRLKPHLLLKRQVLGRIMRRCRYCNPVPPNFSASNYGDEHHFRQPTCTV